MATATKTSNDVASLFLVQVLERESVRVQRWIANIDDMSDYKYFLDETCNAGIIRCTISSKQGAWLYKMLQSERRYGRTIEHVALFNGEIVGTWSYSEGTNRDSCERMTFKLDPAFVQGYMQVDADLLAEVQEVA